MKAVSCEKLCGEVVESVYVAHIPSVDAVLVDEGCGNSGGGVG